MRSERRHELQHNDLADWILTSYERVKPYQNTIIGTVLLLAVAYAAYVWWSGQAGAETAEAWDSYSGAAMQANPVELEKIAEKNSGNAVGQWAHLMVGDLYVAFASDQRFKSRATANEQLSHAVDNYRGLLRSQDPLIRERATFGLARALEWQGHLDEALENYQVVLQTWPEGCYKAVAASRVKDLDQPSTKRFYDDFARFDPKPSYTPETGEGGGKKPLPFEEMVPEEPKAPQAPQSPQTNQSPKATGDAGLKYHSPFNGEVGDLGAKEKPAAKEVKDKASGDKSSEPKASTPEPAKSGTTSVSGTTAKTGSATASGTPTKSGS